MKVAPAVVVAVVEDDGVVSTAAETKVVDDSEVADTAGDDVFTITKPTSEINIPTESVYGMAIVGPCFLPDDEVTEEGWSWPLRWLTVFMQCYLVLLINYVAQIFLIYFLFLSITSYEDDGTDDGGAGGGTNGESLWRIKFVSKTWGPCPESNTVLRMACVGLFLLQIITEISDTVDIWTWLWMIKTAEPITLPWTMTHVKGGDTGSVAVADEKLAECIQRSAPRVTKERFRIPPNAEDIVKRGRRNMETYYQDILTRHPDKTQPLRVGPAKNGPRTAAEMKADKARLIRELDLREAYAAADKAAADADEKVKADASGSATGITAANPAAEAKADNAAAAEAVADVASTDRVATIDATQKQDAKSLKYSDGPYDIDIEDGDKSDKMIVSGMTLRHKYFNILFIVIPKMALAIVLAVIGGIFIVRSEDNETVILNALAAYFIVEVDEYLFSATQDRATARQLQELPPFKKILGPSRHKNNIWFLSILVFALAWGGSWLIDEIVCQDTSLYDLKEIGNVTTYNISANQYWNGMVDVAAQKEDEVLQWPLVDIHRVVMVMNVFGKMQSSSDYELDTTGYNRMRNQTNEAAL